MKRRLLRGGCGTRVRFTSSFTIHLSRFAIGSISITRTIDFHIHRRMCMQLHAARPSPLHSTPLHSSLFPRTYGASHSFPVLPSANDCLHLQHWQVATFLTPSVRVRSTYSLELMRASHSLTHIHTYTSTYGVYPILILVQYIC